MGTHCIVALPAGDGWQGRYVHSDGYPKGALKTLLALVQRDGVEVVKQTITADHYGWSSLSEATPDITGVRVRRAEYNPYAYPTPQWWAYNIRHGWCSDGRFAHVPGYGIAYTTKDEQSAPDDWHGPDDDAPFAYVLAKTDILVLAWRDGWQHVDRVRYDAQPTEEDYTRWECGDAYEHCGHVASYHFDAAQGTRVGTHIWLGREAPRLSDAHAVVLPDGPAPLQGSGGQYYANGERAWGNYHAVYNPRRPKYWFAAVEGRGDVRIARCTKAGYRLERPLVVHTAKGRVTLPVGAVVQ